MELELSDSLIVWLSGFSSSSCEPSSSLSRKLDSTSSSIGIFGMFREYSYTFLTGVTPKILTSYDLVQEINGQP